MLYTIEKLPEEPIIILVHEGQQDPQEIDEAADEIVPLLDAQPEPVFLVLDIRGLAIRLEDMPAAAAKATRGSGAPLHHPNIRENLIVSSSGLVRLGAQGLRSATFGNVNVRVFETPEQAIDYCREKIAAEAGQPTSSAFD